MKNIIIWQKFIKLNNFLDKVRANQLKSVINDAEKIIEFRGQLQNYINDLSNTSMQILGVKTAYYINFAVVAFCDELISVLFARNELSWPKLQKDMYDTENGGEQFYSLLDQIIEQPTFPIIVYQVYYYLLNDGFKGVLVDESKKSQFFYVSKLKELLESFFTPNTNSEHENFERYKRHIKVQNYTRWRILNLYSRKYYIIPMSLIIIGAFVIINILIYFAVNRTFY
ncbi:DotU family type IV/VI secretion system protein [Lentisphaerota bacterium WC36G]|nr:DotU family type IV/VI secretion system protein [Lentisphaerae bacterium WC36]